MTPEQFAYWLQGYAEISGKQPTESEWQVIKDKLQSLFINVTWFGSQQEINKEALIADIDEIINARTNNSEATKWEAAE